VCLLSLYIKISISLKVSELDKSRDTTPDIDDNINSHRHRHVDDTVGFHLNCCSFFFCFLIILLCFGGWLTFEIVNYFLISYYLLLFSFRAFNDHAVYVSTQLHNFQIRFYFSSVQFLMPCFVFHITMFF
jgi:hypothetical protein